MSDIVLALGFAVFIWWFSTGIVLLLNRMSRIAIRRSLLLSTLLGVGAFAGLEHTAYRTGAADAYCAFTSALLVWGWHELSFLTGWITGPRKSAIPPGLSEGRRFLEAVRAILWHEIGIIVVGSAIVAITWNAPNQVGTGTYLVLWVMRTSAKLNLFFGVRNLSEEFLPANLRYLESFFRRRAVNLLFPFSVTIASVILAMMVAHALDTATSPVSVVGTVLVSTMLTMAIVEHWMLVLPIDTTALWRWALKGAGHDHAPTPLPVAAHDGALPLPLPLPLESDEKLLRAR
jgi:putative photosynthetic complex assembly protein 2